MATLTIGGIKIDTPVMNAACSVAKTMDDIAAMSATEAGAVLIGSITREPREINPGPNLQIEEYYTLNSFGMPNRGMDYYQKILPSMVDVIHKAKKKAVLNIAGFQVSDYEKLAELSRLVDLLELNLGCPNVKDKGSHQEIISFNPELIDQIIKAVQKVARTPLMVKVSPYSNPGQLEQVALILRQNKVAAVVTSNTFPNGVFTGTTIKGAAGHAGISGKALMPIAIGQVSQFRRLLPRSIAVIGVGGVETKQDTRAYFEAGADMVQAATLIVRDGHSAINRLI